jgi:hypothetical protein
MTMHVIPMSEDLLADCRAFFPTLLRSYLESGNLNWRELGRHRVSLQLVCRLLWNDDSMFLPTFDYLIRRTCGDEYTAWLRKSGTYGGAARVVSAHADNYLRNPNGYPRPPVGLWVSNALSAELPSTDKLLLEHELSGLPIRSE